jgi:hypothetical protein
MKPEVLDTSLPQALVLSALRLQPCYGMGVQWHAASGDASKISCAVIQTAVKQAPYTVRDDGKSITAWPLLFCAV